jgi:arylsulfatase A-like enzyme
VDGYLFRSDDFPAGHVPDEADKSFISDLYDAEIWSLDAAVDAFLNEVDLSRGDVAVVMTSDHGEGLGEAGLWSHDDLHAPQTRVPFIVFAPGRVEAGAVIDVHVSGLDVAPTLLKLAGALPENASLPGTALVGVVPDEDRVIFIQDYDNPDPARDGHAVIRGRYKLISRFGKRSLHDVVTDPLDAVDLAEQYPQIVAELSAALDLLLAAESDDEDIPDNLDALRALGYMGD